MGQQLNLAGKVKALAKATAVPIRNLWVESVGLDPKRRDLAMSRDIGPNRWTLHSPLMTCG